MEHDPNLSRRNTQSSQSYPPAPEEEAAEGLSSNLSQRSQAGFAKKVYGILGTQIITTALWLVALTRNPEIRRFVRDHEGLSTFSGIVALAGMLGLGLSDRLARNVPINYILLAVTTIAQMFASSLSISYFPSTVVAQAGLATAAAVGGITYTAFTRRTENWNVARTIMNLGFAVVVVQLFSFIFLGRGGSQNILLSSLFGILSGLTLLYQTEKVVGNKDRKYSKDDYIRASMNIYLEIMQLFYELLKLLNKLQDKKEDEDSDNKKKNKK